MGTDKTLGKDSWEFVRIHEGFMTLVKDLQRIHGFARIYKDLQEFTKLWERNHKGFARLWGKICKTLGKGFARLLGKDLQDFGERICKICEGFIRDL